MNFLAFKRQVINYFILFYLFFHVGCASTKVPTLKQSPNCKTTLEGYFHSNAVFGMAVPFLMLNKKDYPELLFGKLKSLEENGVRFDPNRESPFYDPEETFYPFEDVKVLIGRNGEVIYGEVPDDLKRKWSLSLYIVNDSLPEPETMRLILNENSKFSFCLPSGSYTITDIIFFDYDNKTNQAIDFPEMKIYVTDKCSNYLGDLYLGYENLNDSNTALLPYKFLRNSNANFSSFGLIGGAISGAADEASKSSEIIGKLKFTVKSDENFIKEGSGPLKVNLLRVKK